MSKQVILGVLLIAMMVMGTNASYGIDFFFTPDTVQGNVGETVLVSGMINASPSMRSYTIYMAYDTNLIRLSEPPVAGSAIAGHQGLNFNYFDHVSSFLPDLLEITATVFGTDFWSGPGELFRARFVLRQCGVAPITSPYPPFFIAADDTYPPGAFSPALILICNPAPQSPSHLTIKAFPAGSVSLRWNGVRTDILGRPLGQPVSYQVYRQQVMPSSDPPVLIITVPDTFVSLSLDEAVQSFYEVNAVIAP